MIRLLAAIVLTIALAVPTTASADTRYIPAKRVVVTWYLPTGNATYSGTMPRLGTAACDWSIPMGTVVLFPDARVVRCEDRGILGSSGHVDIYVDNRDAGREVATAYPGPVTVSLFLP
jgi:3D (Asp-Asp-Asp) domain-containing protein